MAVHRFLAAWALIAASWCAGVAQAQPLPAGMTRGSTVEGVTEYQLANGLQILLIPDDSKPTVTVNMTYKVGSKHESYGETGMAHLLEHLIFKGTPTTPLVWGEFSRRGFRANGTTWTDRTNYFASLAYSEEQLKWYLGWQADAMVNSFIARKDLDSEMTVVRNEMELGENNPVRVSLERLMGAAYQWHNYGKSTLGARADVENVDIARLQAFYRQYYQPDNAVLIVSGKFEPAKVLVWIADAFGRIPRPARVLPRLYTLDPAQDGERLVNVRRVGGTPLVIAGYHVPGSASPDSAAVALLEGILGNAPSGRLHQRIVEKQGAASAFGFGFAFADPTQSFFALQLSPGQDVDQAQAAMTAVLDGLDKEPITSEELERARTQWLKRWELEFTNPEQVGVAMSAAIALGDWRMFFLARDRVRGVRLQDVQSVAARYLVPDNRTVVRYIPTEKPVRAPAPAFVDVAPMVAGYRGDAVATPAEAFDPTPANIAARTVDFRLPNGTAVALTPKGTRGQLVTGRMQFRYGTETSLAGLEDTATAAAALLDRGAAGMSRQQIQDAFDRLKAQVSFGGGAEAVTVGFTTTRDNVPALIELIGKVLRQPAFPADALEEYRRARLAQLAEASQDPQARVINFIGRHGNPYPRGDVRYTPTFAETETALKGLGREQLVAFHRRFVGGGAGLVSLAGDLDAAAVRRALESAFGDWASTQAYARVPRPAVEAPPVRELLRTPDKQNAFMGVTQPLALNDLHADMPALTLANFIFGTGTGSRLWNRIREKDGLSYGVGSQLIWSEFEPNTRWQVFAIYAPQNRARVEAALREELARVLKDGFTDPEVEAAKVGLANARKLSRAQDGVIAGTNESNLRLGRDWAWQETLDRRLAALTAAEVSAAFRRYIRPDGLVFAFGGDFKE